MLTWTSAAGAQTTGGVFGPVVNAGHRSAQYRAAFDNDDHRLAHRLHYQQSLNGDRMWRVIVQSRETASSRFDFDFVQAELFWQLTPDQSGYQSGLRFDLRLRDGGRPNTIGVNWMHQFRLTPNWSARALLLGSLDVGNNTRDGLFLQSRAHLAHKAGGRTLGLELFSAYGSTDDLFDLNEQNHQLGPFLEARLGGQWSLYGGALFGLTAASADLQLRTFLTRIF